MPFSPIEAHNYPEDSHDGLEPDSDESIHVRLIPSSDHRVGQEESPRILLTVPTILDCLPPCFPERVKFAIIMTEQRRMRLHHLISSATKVLILNLVQSSSHKHGGHTYRAPRFKSSPPAFLYAQLSRPGSFSPPQSGSSADYISHFRHGRKYYISYSTIARFQLKLQNSCKPRSQHQDDTS
ncbi:hypothetical protein FPOAC2_01433 [Fusarium poae]|uniref:Uncharacterized protein n=1 Tax=Fusarium poae TaxID=36050 RepID=A0A1B8B3S0_FUSPO|nr:hypothetical protein FPOA_01306 [Fusarium poae]